MILGDVASASLRIAATRARTEKVALLAGVLRRLEPLEVPIGVAYLSGHLRQGRIGLGWAALRTAMSDAPAATGARAARERSEPTLFDRTEDLAGSRASSDEAPGAPEHAAAPDALSLQEV